MWTKRTIVFFFQLRTIFGFIVQDFLPQMQFNVEMASYQYQKPKYNTMKIDFHSSFFVDVLNYWIVLP